MAGAGGAQARRGGVLTLPSPRCTSAGASASSQTPTWRHSSQLAQGTALPRLMVAESSQSAAGALQSKEVFAAAVLRRSFELSGDEQRQGFKFVYEGVLRDLELADEDVVEFLKGHALEVDAAIGRRHG